jgi:ABC-type dipeptide/oligopeptide/nickel transport system permease subunit
VAVSADTVDAARKVATTFAAFTGLSLVIGAFIGAVSGAIGGRLRDMHP